MGADGETSAHGCLSHWLENHRCLGAVETCPINNILFRQDTRCNDGLMNALLWLLHRQEDMAEAVPHPQRRAGKIEPL